MKLPERKRGIPALNLSPLIDVIFILLIFVVLVARFVDQERIDVTLPSAEAGRLNYDVAAGIIEFSDQATITEGGNQISSNVLVYNVAEQRISAESSGDEDGRVRITYTPTNGTPEPEAAPEDDSQ